MHGLGEMGVEADLGGARDSVGSVEAGEDDRDARTMCPEIEGEIVRGAVTERKIAEQHVDGARLQDRSRLGARGRHKHRESFDLQERLEHEGVIGVIVHHEHDRLLRRPLIHGEILPLHRDEGKARGVAGMHDLAVVGDPRGKVTG